MKKFEYYYVCFKPSDEILEERINLEKAKEGLEKDYVDIDWVLEDAQEVAEHTGVGSIPVRGGRIEVRLKDQKEK